MARSGTAISSRAATNREPRPLHHGGAVPAAPPWSAPGQSHHRPACARSVDDLRLTVARAGALGRPDLGREPRLTNRPLVVWTETAWPTEPYERLVDRLLERQRTARRPLCGGLLAERSTRRSNLGGPQLAHRLH